MSYAGDIPLTNNTYAEIPLDEYKKLHQTLLKSNREERISMRGMELIRVDFIVVGSILTNYIINRLGIKSIYQSSFALKEGALIELL